MRRLQLSQLQSPLLVGSPSTSTRHAPPAHLDIRTIAAPEACSQSGKRSTPHVSQRPSERSAVEGDEVAVVGHVTLIA